MSEHLHRDLQQVRRDVLAMGGLAEEALDLARSAYTNRDESAARSLKQLDRKIDRMQLDIDDHILKLLALHQPVAGDLRFVMAAMKIVNDLERIGDLAAAISFRLVHIVNSPPLGEKVRIDEMMLRVAAMLRNALNSFVEGDAALAREVIRTDDEIDDMNREHLTTLIERMKRDPDAVDTAVAQISISRGVERIADLATNIAEDVVFVVEAQDIRHPSLSAKAGEESNP